jgi:hypothetical protein
MLAPQRMHRLLLAALAASFTLAAGAAAACPICFSGRVSAPGQKIDAADAVVLATPFGVAGPFQVTKPVKGSLATAALIVDAIPAPSALVIPGKPMLLLRNKLSQQWTALGSIGEGEAVWLRQFAAGGPADGAAAKPAWPKTVDVTSDMTDAEWIERLALVAPKLEGPEPLAAEIAYGELARAPYRVLRSLRGARAAADVAGWLADPALAGRQPAYTLLLGIVGGRAEAQAIEARIAELYQAHDAKNLAALIAADLELSGPARMAWVEETYFDDKARSLPEIEAVLLALSVQGSADATIPRARIVSAYRRFIHARPPMASFVVQDLSDWASFEAVGDLEAVLRSGAIKDPGSQFAVVSYLKRSPAARQIGERQVGGDLPP